MTNAYDELTMALVSSLDVAQAMSLDAFASSLVDENSFGLLSDTQFALFDELSAMLDDDQTALLDDIIAMAADMTGADDQDGSEEPDDGVQDLGTIDLSATPEADVDEISAAVVSISPTDLTDYDFPSASTPYADAEPNPFGNSGEFGSDGEFHNIGEFGNIDDHDSGME